MFKEECQSISLLMGSKQINIFSDEMFIVFIRIFKANKCGRCCEICLNCNLFGEIRQNVENEAQVLNCLTFLQIVPQITEILISNKSDEQMLFVLINKICFEF
jgi:hypothetical protein